MTMETSNYVIIPVSITCIAINVCALVILFRTKNLRQNRFNSLVLYLSISDAAIGLYIFIILAGIPFIEAEIKKYVCSFVGTLSTATTLFSIYQVLLICFERLNATYSVPHVYLKRITSNRSVMLGCLIFHLFAIITWVFEILTGVELCLILPSLVGIITLDIPAIAMTTFIFIFYLLILARIKKQENRTRDQRQDQTVSVLINNKRMKRNMITLGIIVFVTIIIIAPRPIAAIIAFITEVRSSNDIVMICTYIIILNPLIDPIIYVFRIKKFRQRLLCCSTIQRSQVNPIAQNMASNSTSHLNQNQKGSQFIVNNDRSKRTEHKQLNTRLQEKCDNGQSVD